ncbi:MAG: Bug family tripartite tricarboxylate transporter substrate binding protein [Betaproteobacteria bacterium]
MRRKIVLTAATISTVFFPWLLHAAEYPARPIRFVIGFAPGGASDTMVRVIGARLSENLRQPVVIDNRPGAGGNIAAEIAARSQPDGYTLLLGNNGILAVNVSLYSKIGFDPVKDFAPVVLVASQPNILAVHPSVAAKSVKELVALAKSKPGQLNYASPGAGTTGHLAAELFKRMAGVDMVIVPFKGGGPAVASVLAAQTQFTFATALSVQPHMKAGRARGLAVSTLQRSPNFPDLPTVAEAGVPGFDVMTWHGVVVPARTPPSVIARLNREFNQILQTPETRERLNTLGSDIIGGQPKKLAEYVRTEIPKWARLIKESGAKVD